MKSWVIHYRNKYPGGMVFDSESAIDVYDRDGNHCISIRKNGSGQWADESEARGCVDRHDLAPIPRDARVHKLVDGKIGEDEQGKQRQELRKEYLCAAGRKVLSCEELRKKGYEFDDKGRAVVKPARPAPQVAAPVQPASPPAAAPPAGDGNVQA